MTGGVRAHDSGAWFMAPSWSIGAAAAVVSAVAGAHSAAGQLVSRELKKQLSEFIVADADSPRTFNNPASDHTRPGGVSELDAISPGVAPVHLLSLSIGPWKPVSNVTGHQGGFLGHYASTQQPHVFRMNMVFAGLVNPPGPLDPGPTGNSGPFAFGNRPLVAIIDLDIDADLDTGGSTPNEAMLRYAANIGRFGAVPPGVLGERSAKSGEDLNFDLYSEPHIERTGEEFSLVLCGCSMPTVTVVRGNQNQQFEAGEAWLVRGRFFRRSSLLNMAGSVFGGSDFGSYDPFVKLLFDHNLATNRTTVSLVYPITQVGAAMLLGGPTQPPDLFIDVNNVNHHSMEEGLLDITLSPPIPGNSVLGRSPLKPAVEAWQGRTPGEYLNPAGWGVRGVVGTIVMGPLAPAAKIVLTDNIGPALHRDVNGDGLVNHLDRVAIKRFIRANEGGNRDLDPGQPDRVRLNVLAGDFSPYDLTGNGVVSIADVERITVQCPADLDGSGTVDIDDYLLFIAAYMADDLLADLDDDLHITMDDYLLFMTLLEEGC